MAGAKTLKAKAGGGPGPDDQRVCVCLCMSMQVFFTGCYTYCETTALAIQCGSEHTMSHPWMAMRLDAVRFRGVQMLKGVTDEGMNEWVEAREKYQ